jgi:signal transduction histidine kinase
MEAEVILVATITLIVLVVIIILFFVIFQTKKNNYVLAQMEVSQKMEQEIAKSKMEIREQSLKNIGWELHDNIGQLLSVARMQLGVLGLKLPQEYKNNIEEIDNLIGDSLQEIRSLSKTLNAEVIHNLGLVNAINLELDRFNRLNFLKAQLTVSGEETTLDQKDEIIIFRILQEFFSNVVKHSKATTLRVVLKYSAESLCIEAQDNGVGFDMEKGMNGSGLINMKSRAHMIGASYLIKSDQNQGVNLLLCYNLKKVGREK